MLFFSAEDTTIVTHTSLPDIYDRFLVKLPAPSPKISTLPPFVVLVSYLTPSSPIVVHHPSLSVQLALPSSRYCHFFA